MDLIPGGIVGTLILLAIVFMGLAICFTPPRKGQMLWTIAGVILAVVAAVLFFSLLLFFVDR